MHMVFRQQIADAGTGSSVQCLIGADLVGFDSYDHTDALYMRSLTFGVESYCANCGRYGECCNYDFLHQSSQAPLVLAFRLAPLLWELVGQSPFTHFEVLEAHL